MVSACKPLPEGDSFRDAEVPWERHIKRHFVVLADTCLQHFCNESHEGSILLLSWVALLPTGSRPKTSRFVVTCPAKVVVLDVGLMVSMPQTPGVQQKATPRLKGSDRPQLKAQSYLSQHVYT
jgi:hypothetical protein